MYWNVYSCVRFALCLCIVSLQFYCIADNVFMETVGPNSKCVDFEIMTDWEYNGTTISPIHGGGCYEVGGCECSACACLRICLSACMYVCSSVFGGVFVHEYNYLYAFCIKHACVHECMGGMFPHVSAVYVYISNCLTCMIAVLCIIAVCVFALLQICSIH